MAHTNNIGAPDNPVAMQEHTAVTIDPSMVGHSNDPQSAYHAPGYIPSNHASDRRFSFMDHANDYVERESGFINHIRQSSDLELGGHNETVIQFRSGPIRPPLRTVSYMSCSGSIPPLYKIHSDAEQEWRRREDEALAQLEERYRYNQSGWFYILTSSTNDSDGNPLSKKRQWLKAFNVCFAEQFAGFYLVFWLIVLVFIGSVSVLVPHLSPAAFLLWLPLAVYLTGLIFFHRIHRQQRAELRRLENELVEAREHRRQFAEQNAELPEDHFFMVEYCSSHTHPVTTLLPPPPCYPHAEEMSTETALPLTSLPTLSSTEPTVPLSHPPSVSDATDPSDDLTSRL
ncbi:uncharacterized protein BYT42DRAFT_582505 [Radiomyces spectabilis]|uniref:uncharacterized protein n=1 Tax=Radiomyces spectabilis TaxID=64574 RepID=UPI002221275A|nr:uncharacterized protein BYT42DRAFT_582505 [Radiomyces spectabilis]KAI8370457.1 hypothetical protein BYT42DRAFT_582505 [Radiomyces spectabilis]